MSGLRDFLDQRGSKPPNADDDRHEQWEETAVKKLLTFYGLGSRVKVELARQHHERHGQYLLTLAGFLQHFPRFPCNLAARRVKDTLKLGVDLALRWTKTDLCRAVAECFPERGDRCQALIFPWAKWTTTVVHNQMPSMCSPGYWFVRQMVGSLVVIEPLDQFLEQRVGRDWLEE